MKIIKKVKIFDFSTISLLGIFARFCHFFDMKGNPFDLFLASKKSIKIWGFFQLVLVFFSVVSGFFSPAGLVIFVRNQNQKKISFSFH